MNKNIEVLEILCDSACIEAGEKPRYITYAKEIEHNAKVKEKYNIIKQYIEELEKENQELKEQLKLSNDSQETVINTMSLVEKEKEQLEKALDKACERLDWDCPVSQGLINDLDCENRCSEDFEECCKECWKIYFLKEVLKNE